MLRRTDLVGEWSLVNFEIVKQDGTRKTWGKNTHGMLIYTDDGYMSVAINRAIENPNPSAQDILNSVLFYSGTFEVKADKIIHHVRNATDLNKIGKDLVREASLENNQLHLIGKGDFGTSRLTWKLIISL